MILLSALVLGLLAGWGWARWKNQRFRAPDLQFLWLVPVAFLPQLAIAYMPTPQDRIPPQLTAVALPFSLILFLAFVWLNRRLPGMPILMAGLILNLIVITANGGWMPISPETASRLHGGVAAQDAIPGSHFGQKDILLLPQSTHFGLLSDRFLLPRWFPYQVAFSLGDILVAMGVFWLLADQRPMPSLERSET